MARLSLPFADWPPADQALWRAAVADGDILDGAGPCADWAPTTRNNARKAYGYWLRWLDENGGIDADVAPVDRLTPKRIAAYISSLEARVAASTVFAYILDLLRYVKRVAPDRDWAWLIAIKNRLWARASPAKDKTLRIRPAADLFALGIELMRTAAGITNRYNRLAAEIQFRDGLVIALLAARPIRLKTLTALEIGRHLVRIDGVYWLRLESHEVKNAMHIEAAFSVAISPHLFRDCAATSVAIEDPEHVRIAAAILGHHSLATTQRYYDQSRMPELRIIDDDLWTQVQDRQTSRTRDTRPDARAPDWRHRCHKHLFSGLIKCGNCGGGMSLVSRVYYGCSSRRNKGICDNALTVRLDRLEDTVLEGLQQSLLTPALTKEFSREYTREINRPSCRAIARIDCFVASPLDIVSRSQSVSARRDRRRWAGRIPPCGEM